MDKKKKILFTCFLVFIYLENRWKKKIVSNVFNTEDTFSEFQNNLRV